MLDAYLEIFEQTVIVFAPLIAPIIGIYLVFYFMGSLLFDRR